MTNSDRKNLRRFCRKYVSPESRLLDVGCGLGENLELLRALGFNSLVGTDISKEMVDRTREKGFEAYTVDELRYLNDKYDAILFSHVIEHVGYPEIQSFLETYLGLLESREGYVIIITPVLYDAFYNDVDHIKPYYVDGLLRLFSTINVSQQYESPFRFNLIDLRYRRQIALPYNIRCRFIRTPFNLVKMKILNALAAVAFFVSFGLFGKTSGYVAIFRVSCGNGEALLEKTELVEHAFTPNENHESN